MYTGRGLRFAKLVVKKSIDHLNNLIVRNHVQSLRPYELLMNNFWVQIHLFRLCHLQADLFS